MAGKASLMSAAAVAAVVVGVAAVASVNGQGAETQDASAVSGVPATPAVSATPTKSAAPATSAAPAATNDPTPSHLWKSMLVQGRAPEPTMDEAMLQDLSTLAEQTGESLDEVVATTRGSMEFTDIANDLESDPRSGYVAAAWRRNTTAIPWIRFTTKPDESVRQRIENELSLQVELQWGAPLTGRQLVRVAETIYSAVSDFPGVETAVGGPQPDNSIEIFYRLEPDVKIDASRLRKKALRAGAQVSPTGEVPVEVRLVESPDLQVKLK